MRKLRSDALWHKLSAEQQTQIQNWLFVDNLSYVQTHQRMRDELGVTCALSVIGRIYRYFRKLRSTEREAVLQTLANVITEPGADIAGIRTASLTVINRRLMERAMRRDNTNEIVALGRVLVRAEGRDIERQRVELAREKCAQSKAGRERRDAISDKKPLNSDDQVNNHPNLSDTNSP